jgi:hypothetical protein
MMPSVVSPDIAQDDHVHKCFTGLQALRVHPLVEIARPFRAVTASTGGYHVPSVGPAAFADGNEVVESRGLASAICATPLEVLAQHRPSLNRYRQDTSLSPLGVHTTALTIRSVKGVSVPFLCSNMCSTQSLPQRDSIPPGIAPSAPRESLAPHLAAFRTRRSVRTWARPALGANRGKAVTATSVRAELCALPPAAATVTVLLASSRMVSVCFLGQTQSRCCGLKGTEARSHLQIIVGHENG